MLKINSQVKINNEISSLFMINNGLKQEDAMSLVLFNMTLECNKKNTAQ